MAETYPTINGHDYSFSDIEFRWGANRYSGFKAINYRHSRETNQSEGSRPEGYGYPRGSYNGCEGDITFLRETFNQLIADMGDGYMEEVIPLVLVMYAPKGKPIVTDELKGITISEEDFSNERGGDSSYVQVSFKGLLLKPNGVSPIANVLE